MSGGDQAMAVFDPRPCDLGEGPLWHPGRAALYWFDITGKRLFWRRASPGGESGARTFDEMHSAAGRVDDETLIIASQTGLWRFDLITGQRSLICPLEADDPVTRSNDGRADPQGGFWIGTMGCRAERGAGSIWRWHRGTLRRLYANITIPNAISFTPDGRAAHFTDTVTRRIMKVALDAQGWPAGKPETFIDLSARDGGTGLNPDGAVVDAQGLLWVAQWGAGRVAAHAPDGSFVTACPLPAPHATCPAFGGLGLGTLYCTSARQGLDSAGLQAAPLSGQTFSCTGIATGLPEPAVVLD